MSFDRTIEQLQLFSNLFFDKCTTFKIILTTGKRYRYGKFTTLCDDKSTTFYVGNELSKNNVEIGYMHNVNVNEPLF